MTIQHIAVAGSSGRMGRALIEAIGQSTDFRLSAALELPGNPCLGKDAGELVGAPCAGAWTHGRCKADSIASCLGNTRRCQKGERSGSLPSNSSSRSRNGGGHFKIVHVVAGVENGVPHDLDFVARP